MGFNRNDYQAKVALTEGMSYSDALKIVMTVEEKASRFYLNLVEQSTPLLATILSSFRKVTERRNSRKLKVESLLNKLNSQTGRFDDAPSPQDSSG